MYDNRGDTGSFEGVIMALDTSAKARKSAAGSDIYTAMLALAMLILAATTGFVAYQAWSVYGSVFTAAGS